MNSETERKGLRIQHGFDKGYYTLLPDHKPHPVVWCMCGWTAADISDSWEEVGKKLDEHIAGALKKEDIAYHDSLKEHSKAMAARR
jgi:hypothetical protein